MDADGLAWVDSVPAGRRRPKRLVLGEHEFRPTTSISDGRRRLTTRFYINNTEVEGTLVEVGRDVAATGARAEALPRLSVGGRSYVLTIAACSAAE